MLMKRLIGWWLAAACLVAACGGTGEGPPLGDFPAISKLETDAAFTLVAPSSRSPAAFTFTSSNLSVATIDGALVTIRGPGESTITAAQASLGSYGPTQKTTTLTVTAVACATNSVRVNGVCTAVPTCISPATVVDNKCTAPTSTSTSAPTTISVGAFNWMGVAWADTYANARDFCAGTVIDGATGWRLPTAAELSALFTSGAIAGHNWALGNTWSSTMGADGQVAGHVAVNLDTGAAAERGDTLGAYVSCVH
jgi:hypothetical protein